MMIKMELKKQSIKEKGKSKADEPFFFAHI
jgi:hypothetical protein